jgi:2-oxoglutarate dehydrogenase E2 component (dihydrolipoamide succinyltransferase)
MNASTLELKVPSVGESVTEVEVGDWLKQPGDTITKDETLVVLETDKATVEVPSPVAGRLASIARQSGERVKVGDLLGTVEAGGQMSDAGSRMPEAEPPPVMPAAARVLAEKGIPPTAIPGTGPGGRILKEDAQRAASQRGASVPLADQSLPTIPAITAPAASTGTPASGIRHPASVPADRPTEVVPMTLIRRKIAEHLVRAKTEAALLTTFNEIDMSAAMALRKEYQERFQERYGIKLGFMSFFVKAAVEALKEVPQVNAQIRDQSIIYHGYQDIGVAIGGGKGLVVPVIRNAERLSFAEVEQVIADFGKRAKDGKLKPDELTGGTFTITNGGIYGSLLSTPIVNPPQSGVLGMHAIQDRPVALNGQVVIRPMMYVALTYDHRLVDGREAVTFLKRVKELVENPVRMLIEV